MNRNDLRSQSLNLLRFPLAVVVLVIHVFSSEGFVIRGQEFNFSDNSFFLEITYFINGFLRGQSVPIYFFISGLVFFLGIELTKEKYIQKLKNRVKTLLIPYIVWNVVAIVLLVLRLLPWFSHYLAYSDRTIDFSFLGFLSCFWMYHGELSPAPMETAAYEMQQNSLYPIDAPLWFVRDLMLIVLVTPLLYWMLKRTRHYFVLILGILWFIFGCWDLSHFYQLLTGTFFFSWGAYMSVNRKDMLFEFNRFFKPSMFLYPSLAILYVFSRHYFPEASGIIKQLNIVVGLFFAYNLAAWLLNHNICKANSFLASASFFIYVSHIFVCDRLVKIFFLLINPASDFAILSVYILSAIFTTLSLLLVFYLLRLYLPGLLKVIAGRN